MVIEFPVSSDLREREAALDIAVSCIVEAPAGSGKTGLLIQRYLKVLATVDQPEEVLALTFTNKATAEMLERIVTALRSAADGTASSSTDFERLTRDLALAVLNRDIERQWHLLQRTHLLNIRTIDSLCGQIARSLPLLSGEAGVARPVADATALYARASHAVMMQFGGADDVLNDAVRTVLLHRDGDLAFCEKVLAEMLQTREQWGSLVPLGEQLTEEHLEKVTLPRLNEALARTVCAALGAVQASFDDDALAEIARIAERHAYGEGYKEDANPFLVCAGRQSSPGCTVEDLDHWQALAKLLLTDKGWRVGLNRNHVKTVLDENDKSRLKELINSHGSMELYELLDAVRAFDGHTYPADQWRVSKALFRLLERALIELQLLFAHEEVCDFSEVALAARGALHENAGEVQSALGTRLQHLLVDEMQDTSSGQYELLQTLTAGWDGSSQTVFLVGDPKQSIYLFRQARVDRFQRCMQDGRLGDVPLQVLRLSANFRSGGALVEEFNHTFTRIFPPHSAPEGDVDFQPAVAANKAGEGESMRWHLEALPTVEELSENRRARRQSVRREARTIARTVQRWRQEHAGQDKLPRIAVLTRARSHVTEIAKALAKESIPYRAIDLESLAEQQEVLDVLAITRALLHPADRTAWLALLRAPWCGLSLVDLHTLVGGDDTTHRKDALRPWLRKRCDSLPPAEATRGGRTLDVMDAALRHGGTEPLADRVERTWRSLGGDLCTNALGRENVRQFLRVLDTMEAEGEPVTLPSLNHRLEKLFAQPSHAVDAIDILTIHRAKGLEWDLVILPGLHRVAGRESLSALEWLELPTIGDDGRPDVLLAPIPGKGGEPGPLLKYIRTQRRTRIYLELKRLFYVAVTRARTSLHLFASPEATRDGKPTIRRGTLLYAALGNDKEAEFVDRMPPRAVPMEAAEPLALAASAENEATDSDEAPDPQRSAFRLPPFQRLRASIDPLARLRSAPLASHTHAAAALTKRFVRPQGSFGARAVGNAIHAFVERISRQIATSVAAGTDAPTVMDQLLEEIPSWVPAVRATLRAGSLPADEVDRASYVVERALKNLLQSQDGRWILLPHRGAEDESAWRSGDTRVRLDRSFFAGSKPRSAGDDTLWIIDFKTADRAEAEQNAFLQAERTNYAQQLRTYAQMRLRTLPAETPIMLALFYPLMGRLISWRYEPAEEVEAPLLHVPAPEAEEQEPPTNTKGQFSLFG